MLRTCFRKYFVPYISYIAHLFSNAILHSTEYAFLQHMNMSVVCLTMIAD